MQCAKKWSMRKNKLFYTGCNVCILIEIGCGLSRISFVLNLQIIYVFWFGTIKITDFSLNSDCLWFSAKDSISSTQYKILLILFYSARIIDKCLYYSAQPLTKGFIFILYDGNRWYSGTMFEIFQIGIVFSARIFWQNFALHAVKQDSFGSNAMCFTVLCCCSTNRWVLLIFWI